MFRSRFCLHFNSSACLRLTDVLHRLGIGKDEFTKRHKTVEISSLSLVQFEKHAKCRDFHPDYRHPSQSFPLPKGHKVSKAEAAGFVELVRLDDHMRAILDIRTLRLKDDGVSA